MSRCFLTSSREITITRTRRFRFDMYILMSLWFFSTLCPGTILHFLSQGLAVKIFSYAISCEKYHGYLTEAVEYLVKLMSDSSVDINIMVIFTKLVGQFSLLANLNAGVSNYTIKCSGCGRINSHSLCLPWLYKSYPWSWCFGKNAWTSW